MYVLVTGAAGFIGSQVSDRLLSQGARVLGLDNLNDYYEVSLKEARLARLTGRPGFEFVKADISDRDAIMALSDQRKGLTHVIHLAAQAGVRYSLIDPYAYVSSNVMGHVVMSEFARRIEGLQHFVYASSSSVYGANKELPFSVADRVDQPDSLYAATKRSDELLARTYAHLWNLPCTGLRFFTVYGPWGRPDMAAFIFTKAIYEGRKITVFNNGEMWRDFTYVDDIVSGVVAVAHRPPTDVTPPAKVYNIGNHKSEKLTHFVEVLEQAIGKKAEIEFAPMQPGDVAATYADIEATTRDFGFVPTTSIEDGLPRFVQWYRDYYGVNA
ncbi:MAG TPA: SDR family NAD(P)-dependent oxidoreductase [Caulobacteraceae bacterium]